MEKVSHPNHYNMDGEKDKDGSSEFEAIKVIEDWGFGIGFCFGNALKYICRAEHKGSMLRDLKSAKWYLERVHENHRWSQDIRSQFNTMNTLKYFPMKVSTAWKLSGRLQRVVEHIYALESRLAANEIQKYIDEIEEEIDRIEQNG